MLQLFGRSRGYWFTLMCKNESKLRDISWDITVQNKIRRTSLLLTRESFSISLSESLPVSIEAEKSQSSSTSERLFMPPKIRSPSPWATFSTWQLFLEWGWGKDSKNYVRIIYRPKKNHTLQECRSLRRRWLLHTEGVKRLGHLPEM